MTSITSAGIGSGLDVEGIISKLMAAERIPLNTIKTNTQTTQTKLSIYGIIKSSFDGLQTATNTLKNLSNIYPLTATSSNSSVVTGSATSASAKGSYSLTVQQLAQKQSIAANAVSTTDTAIGTGTLTITLGSYNATGNTFTANSSATPVSITINSSNQTLSGVKDAINNANAGVTASIINDGTGNRLVLTSNTTGAVNGFKVGVVDNDGTNTDMSGLSMLSYDPTAAAGSGKNQTSLASAQDAQFTLNNIAITKPTNNVTDAVSGLTLNLLSTTTTPVTLNVGLDSTALQGTLNKFIAAYNQIQGNLTDQQQKGATLVNDTTPSQLELTLRNTLRNSGSTYGLTLADIGINFDKTGVMSLDSTKLNSALATDPRIVEKVFADTGSSSDSRVRFNGGTSLTRTGTYAINVSTAYNGTNTVVGTINGVNANAIGNVLTGATGDASEGLSVTIASGASGSLGTVTYNKGLASTLSDWITSLNNPGGALVSRTDGLNAKIKSLNNDASKLSDRLTIIEANYRKQFNSLDTLLASMQATSSYLTQQLSALAANTK
ncbi:flagellar filament capping protein FliD [Limnobacter litoralis]|uniref:Flagellar hook-associated protein 2 n=1 Tax=Limnobacter litoralis TaxID=481366 RepID=A0ABQ5YT44_9BURK|nr:flagellar filament capping protein FliD [Limnobacter litoralis]GLR27668.1 flagellar hook-associated protein 2 [Limnobacter litoralis]